MEKLKSTRAIREKLDDECENAPGNKTRSRKGMPQPNSMKSYTQAQQTIVRNR
jgi:hypothetical protein